MDGAVLALLRVQDTYSLNTSQLTDSNLGLKSAEDEAPPLSGKAPSLSGYYDIQKRTTVNIINNAIFGWFRRKPMRLTRVHQGYQLFKI